MLLAEIHEAARRGKTVAYQDRGVFPDFHVNRKFRPIAKSPTLSLCESKHEVSDAKALHNLFDVRVALYCRVCSQEVPHDCSVYRSRCSGRGCDQQGQERQHETEDDSSASRQS